MSKRLCVLGLALALSSIGMGQEQVSINLTGLKFKNALNQTRDSAPNTISPAFAYEYHVNAMVKGDGGILQILYPNPVDLREVLETLAAGASAALDGEIYNSNNSHPAGILGQHFEGDTELAGIDVHVGATVSAGIRATNVAFFSFTDVVITPSFLVGGLLVTSGTTTIERLNVTTGDMNWDGSINQFDILGFVEALTDPISYIERYGHIGEITGDCNRDGTLSQFDIVPFVNILTH